MFYSLPVEDIDRFFIENRNVLIHNDPNAKSSKRPAHYITHEQEEMRRNSSVVPDHVDAMLQRRNVGKDGSVDAEKGDTAHIEG